MNIAIITARGGSKRIPRKNIKEFLGKPMIAWPIEAAKKSGCFTHVLVSTEDEEIASIARQFGAEVPFMRSMDLADDFTHANVPARQMLEWSMRKWDGIAAFAHIYPTSPFLTPQDIQAGAKLLKNDIKFVYTAQRINFPIYQAVIKTRSGKIEALFPPEKAAMRSQDMPAAFIDAGQLYWYDTQAFLDNNISSGEIDLITLPKERALDIDTVEDWQQAEKMALLFEGNRI